jgi:hypothetical protein
VTADEPAEQRPEEEQERLNRRLMELLNEIRVAMPGVQVLFGFLLAVPFQQRFAQATRFQRDAYFFTLVASAAATALFIAPSAYHRMMFGQGDRPNVIRVGTRLFILGLVALALAMNGAILLVTDVLFSPAVVTVTIAATGSLFVWLWFAMGLLRRRRES